MNHNGYLVVNWSINASRRGKWRGEEGMGRRGREEGRRKEGWGEGGGGRRRREGLNKKRRGEQRKREEKGKGEVCMAKL